MDYFLLKQDKRYSNTPQILNLFKKFNTKDLNLVKADNIEDNNILYVKSAQGIEYLDILNIPIFLVSEELQRILSKYNSNIVFKMVALTDYKNLEQYIYYLPIFEEVQALNEESEFNLNKTIVKKIVLDENKIKNKKIFKIKESDKTLIVVRLDVAESLLRRDFKGILLERLEVKK
ncbi:imm11 family protein [Clostridium taeniosporum]|uniref:Immunity MXAN-0049 protein domain-containing protein n=1 Tax=Clostridium taeniosporum TaxID=394958 RepID=A0A1D7XJH1_9CLOT|nr:DUF1629 domain-containing protein [Clostridium taeniosporum]AOR23487.1 hypothetical protein BGI42_06930 [Clostridium taeniosporum]